MSRRILVGYDHTEEAEAGLRRAVGLARTERAELTVVHVAVPPPSWVGVGLLALPLIDDVVSSGDLLVRRAVDELPDDLAVRWHLITGADASAGLCRHRCVRRALHRALEHGDHDLIVLGTGTKPGRVARAFLRMCPDLVVTAPYAPQVAVGGASGSRSVPVLPSLS
jgi:nucleotide-binding universal stress UspA family protein